MIRAQFVHSSLLDCRALSRTPRRRREEARLVSDRESSYCEKRRKRDGQRLRSRRRRQRDNLICPLTSTDPYLPNHLAVMAAAPRAKLVSRQGQSYRRQLPFLLPASLR